MSERLQRYALIAEIIGAAAVVISLIFVGWELRQSTRLNQIEATQTLVQNYQNSLDVLSYEADGACIYVNGINGLEYLNDVERLRFFVIMFNITRTSEQLYHYSLEGMIDERTWRGFKRQIQEVMSYNGSRQWWEIRKSWFSDDYQQYIDELITSTETKEIELFKVSNCSE